MSRCYEKLFSSRDTGKLLSRRDTVKEHSAKESQCSSFILCPQGHRTYSFHNAGAKNWTFSSPLESEGVEIQVEVLHNGELDKHCYFKIYVSKIPCQKTKNKPGKFTISWT
jgi:hypothetical protein